MTIYSFTEAVKLIDQYNPENIDFYNDYVSLNDVIDIAEKYNYHIIATDYMNVTRLSKYPSLGIVQVLVKEF